MEVKKDNPTSIRSKIFQFTCQGENDKSSKLLLRQRQVNGAVSVVCKDRPIRMAFNTYEGIFEIDVNNSNSMVEYPWWHGLGLGPYAQEILSSFFKYNNLTPTWQDCNNNWGTFDEVTGLWTGAVARVSRSHAHNHESRGFNIATLQLS